MKFKHLLMSGMIAILAGFFVVGCEETPSDPVDTRPDAPTDLEAVTLSETSVGLRWVGAIPTGSKYDISWTNSDGSSTGEGTVNEATAYTVNGLTNGVEYTFSVTFVNSDGDESLPTTINWAPAPRYTEDAKISNAVIRIYEKDAPSTAGFGSGLILDPALGGPANQSVANGDLANIQLAADVQGNTFSIGPSKAPEFETVFANWDDFPNNVQVSDDYYLTTSLDDWYSNASLAGLFTENSKNAFIDVPNQLQNNQAMAFAVRIGTGTPNVFQYARVLVVPDGTGLLVRNDGQYDYVVLNISFQGTAGLPFAK